MLAHKLLLLPGIIKERWCSSNMFILVIIGISSYQLNCVCAFQARWLNKISYQKGSHGTQSSGIKSSFVNGASYFPSNRQYMEMPEAVFSLQPYAALHARMAKKANRSTSFEKNKDSSPKRPQAPPFPFQRYDKPINPETFFLKKIALLVDFVQFFFVLHCCVCFKCFIFVLSSHPHTR